MFELEPALAAWRARLARTGSFLEADLDELESHLRDHIDALGEVGITGEEAFVAAVERLGDEEALADEFARAKPAVAWRWPLFWVSAGCFASLVGFAGLHIGAVALVVLGARLGLSTPCLKALGWSLILGAPAIALPPLLVWATGSGGSPLRWTSSACLRVGALVAAACIVVAQRSLHFPLVSLLPADPARWNAVYSAYGALAVVAPVEGVVCTVLAWWYAKTRGSLHRAWALWFLVGAYVHGLLEAFFYFLPRLALLAASLVHVDRATTSVLAWAIVVATPALVFGAAMSLRGRVPPPHHVFRRRTLWLAGAWGIALACFDTVDRLLYRAVVSRFPADVLRQAYRAHQDGGVLVGAAAALAIGIAALRLHESSRVTR